MITNLNSSNNTKKTKKVAEPNIVRTTNHHKSFFFVSFRKQISVILLFTAQEKECKI